MSDFHEKTEKNKLRKSKVNENSKYPILSLSILRKYELDKLLEYIKNLHHVLLKKDKKLKKYKEKLKLFNRNSTKDENLENKDVDVEDNSKVEDKQKNVHSPNFVDEIREAAEIAQNKNGFIYEPTSGLYYDQNTGYYYNAEYGLYYDGNTGCYYKLNTYTNEFEFHSQADSKTSEKEKADDNNDDHDVKRKKSKRHQKSTYYIDDEDDDENYNRTDKIKTTKKYSKLDRKYENRKIMKYDDDFNKSDIEDGELLTASDDEEKFYDYLDQKNNHKTEKYEDVAKKYPPSLRIIVQETNLSKIKVGTLYIITFKGGTLGREGDHDVIIPDINISKFHLKFTYNEKKTVYQSIDLGSRNGTILNGKRMSTAKQESDLMDIVHGSVIQLSQTKLLCHIHPGNSTCGLCEPGLLMELKNDEKTVTLSHKEQLKKLQKKYGLENEKYIETKQDPKYNDRAAVRRVKVGSSSHHEKTQMASTETAISSDNKGFKMLSKLGWNKGETLGKGTDGLLQPISVTGNVGTKGLGNNEIVPTVAKMDLKKLETWKRTQDRYNKLHKPDMLNDDNSASIE